MLKKIFFLYKSDSPITIIIQFLIHKFTNIFSKKKIKLEKFFFLNLISKQRISSEFFSVNAYNFLKYLSPKAPSFRYLEIGSFEGGSAIYVSSKFQNSEIYCVDNWIKTEDGYSNLDFKNVESNFDYNTSCFKNIHKIKQSSDNFFKNNTLNFDVIYVDGHHKAEQVFKDCKNSWKFLNNDGIMICDDYIWNHYKDINNNPCFAINQFLKTIKNYKILRVSNSQIFVKKIFSKQLL